MSTLQKRSEESELSQQVIEKAILQLKTGVEFDSVLNEAINALLVGLNADRVLVWSVIGDQLEVTHEAGKSELPSLISTRLSSSGSTKIVLNFLSQSPEDSAPGIITIEEPSSASKEWSQILSLSVNTGSHIFVHLRARAIFSGFVHVQTLSSREWSDAEKLCMEKVGTFISVFMQLFFDQSKTQSHVAELNVVLKILHLFSDANLSVAEAVTRSGQIIAQHVGFHDVQIYLHTDGEKQLLRSDESHQLDLLDSTNPFVEVFTRGRGKVKRGPSGTESDIALYSPLIFNDKKLGVMGMSTFRDGRNFFPSTRELAMSYAGHLSKAIWDSELRQTSEGPIEKWADELPSPLATILWRYVSDNDTHRKQTRLLKFFEASAQWFCCIALSALRSDPALYNQTRERWCKGNSDRREDWKRATFGQYVSLGERLSKIIREISSTGSSKSVLDLFRVSNTRVVEALTDKELYKLFRRVLDYRNKWHGHGGLPGPTEVASRLDKLEQELRKFERLTKGVFTNWWLTKVVDSRFNYDGSYVQRVQKVMGSRTTFKEFDVISPTPMFSDLMYMLDRENNKPLMVLPFCLLMLNQETEEYSCCFYSRFSPPNVEWVSYHSGIDSAVTNLNEMPAGKLLEQVILELEGTDLVPHVTSVP